MSKEEPKSTLAKDQAVGARPENTNEEDFSEFEKRRREERAVLDKEPERDQT